MNEIVFLLIKKTVSQTRCIRDYRLIIEERSRPRSLKGNQHDLLLILPM